MESGIRTQDGQSARSVLWWYVSTMWVAWGRRTGSRASGSWAASGGQTLKSAVSAHGGRSVAAAGMIGRRWRIIGRRRRSSFFGTQLGDHSLALARGQLHGGLPGGEVAAAHDLDGVRFARLDAPFD